VTDPDRMLAGEPLIECDDEPKLTAEESAAIVVLDDDEVTR